MTYDINAVAGVYDLYSTANALSGGIYTTLGLFAVLAVAFTALYSRGNPASSSLAAASFISTIAAVFFWVVNLVGAEVVAVHFAIFVLATLWTRFV